MNNSQLYSKNPNDTRVRMMTQCDNTFKYNDSCPNENYLNFGSVNSIGKDLLNNTMLLATEQDVPAQRAIDASIHKRRCKISFEGCTLSRAKQAYKC